MAFPSTAGRVGSSLPASGSGLLKADVASEIGSSFGSAGGCRGE